MQIKITLQCLEPAPVLPLSYQYELSAWIYKVIANADKEYATFLHHHGHISPNKRNFKLLCFSNLDVPRFEISGDRLHIKCRDIYLKLGFYVDKTAFEFLSGLFQEQRFGLGDQKSRADFSVKTIEMLPAQPIVSPVRIRLRSPLTLGRERTEEELAANPGDKQELYISPEDASFNALFFGNLMEKYQTATGQTPPAEWQKEQWHLRVIGSPPRSKLITIKKGKDGQTKVRGFIFDFEIAAPLELIEIGLGAGFGHENAQGFGFGEVIQIK